MDVIIQLAVFLTLLCLGYVFGSRTEHKHYESIREREEQLRQLVVLTSRLPLAGQLNHEARLVAGNVVISVDFFKSVLASLRNLVGGNVNAYESLLDRARREAVLRLQAAAKEQGAEAVINLKFETSRVSGNASQGLGLVEVLAYGTAMIPR
ncbi:MAG: YbjQ family protein [Halieaceae bacterium]|nr:YbjQ family protein [Halieaceae bacterium]